MTKPRIKIELPTTWYGVDTREAYRKAMEKEAEPEETYEAEAPGSVKSLNDYWEIPNVEYRNGVYKVDLSKTLLDSDNAKTQDDWIAYSIDAMNRNDFYTGDMALQYAVFKALSTQNTQESLEARDFIKSQMRLKWLMTTTKLIYTPKGKDTIIHNYKMPNELKINVDLIGSNKFVDADDSSVLEALLGDSDAGRVNQIFNFINGTNAYIWRLYSRPKKIDERVARFSAGSGRAGFFCGGDSDYAGSSLGVFAVAQAGENARGQGGRK